MKIRITKPNPNTWYRSKFRLVGTEHEYIKDWRGDYLVNEIGHGHRVIEKSDGVKVK